MRFKLKSVVGAVGIIWDMRGLGWGVGSRGCEVLFE